MDPRITLSIVLFNRREFFLCHETLEEVWTHEHGPRRLFLQALIHFAVAFYHDSQSNPVGAARQFRKGLAKLAPFLPEREGIDTALLHLEMQAALATVEAGDPVERFPLIRLVETARAV